VLSEWTEVGESSRHFFCGLAQDCFNDCRRNGFEQVLLETRGLAFSQIFHAGLTAHRNRSPGPTAAID
jgi:hypothetical protein